MKKFSKILENYKPSIVPNSVESLKKIIEYLRNTEECSSFNEYICEYIERDEEDEFNEYLEDIDNFDDFLKLLEKFGVVDESKDHIYFHVMVIGDLIKKLKPTGHYMKQINET